MARKPHKYHYIYKITCLKNGKYYIGMHSTDNLEDGYMGGGKRIKNSVKKHGKDVHRKEILEFFENRELLRQREIELVNEELLNDPMCINLQPGGGGGWINAEHKEKNISAFSKGGNSKLNKLWNNSDWRSKRIEKMKSTKFHSKTTEGMRENGFYFDGRKHTEESKRMIGEKNSSNQTGDKNSQYGTCWIFLGNKEMKIKLTELIEYQRNGWNRGRK